MLLRRYHQPAEQPAEQEADVAVHFDGQTLAVPTEAPEGEAGEQDTDPDAEPADEQAEAGAYTGKTRAELRGLAKDRELSTAGNVAELTARLEAHDAEQANSDS